MATLRSVSLQCAPLLSAALRCSPLLSAALRCSPLLSASLRVANAIVAVATMDYVNKYEGRTLWGEGRDLVAKWGATKVIMRARPAGESGLRIASGFCVSSMSFGDISACA
jgi:hypothetical protein